jgi:hypothetical protein
MIDSILSAIAQIFGVNKADVLAVIVTAWAAYDLRTQRPHWDELPSARKILLAGLVMTAVLCILYAIVIHLRGIPNK